MVASGEPPSPRLPADGPRTRWHSAFEAAGIGGFEWDLRSSELVWSDHLSAVFGDVPDDRRPVAEVVGTFVHEEDVEELWQELRRVVEHQESFDVEFRLRATPRRPIRWVRARGRVVADPNGSPRLLGAAYETTDRHDGQVEVASLLDSMSAAFVSVTARGGGTDEQWRVGYVNREAERLLGAPGAELLGQALWTVLPAAAGREVRDRYLEVLRSGVGTTFEVRHHDAVERWLEVRAWPTPVGMSLSLVDVTERHEEAVRTARRATREALLARVTSELTGTLDADEAAARLTRLVVPVLADWCLVTLVSPREPGPDWMRLRDIAWWHPESTLRPGVALLGSLRPKLLSDNPSITLDVMSGRPAAVSATLLTDAIAALPSGPERDRLQLLPRAAGVIVPMRAHGRTLGMLSLFWTDREEVASEDELRVCLDVAGRAGLAFDNARLYERTRRMDEELQKSLITAPRQPDHIELAVRYRAAAEAAHVGGDWYDAFVQADGSTVVVIGDVVGHDEEAAAAMSQVRGLLRGVAATTGEGPAAILSRLDQAMALLRVGVTATVVAARLSPPDSTASGVRLTWSNAGHPPPVLLRPNGSVVRLDRAEADLLLGIEPETDRQERAIDVLPQEVVVLFTDGLVERRGQSLEEGQALLERALSDLSGLSLEELCDALLERMLPEHAGDDVAVVAMRLR